VRKGPFDHLSESYFIVPALTRVRWGFVKSVSTTMDPTFGRGVESLFWEFQEEALKSVRGIDQHGHGAVLLCCPARRPAFGPLQPER
jgi:hypothetical protein